ncbi:MAG: hypothetical protein HY051_06250 [Candidatus Aenigmarchaeota archaeon]|nr:hypothetical protein [Candidatus Aenigmarchaeota archaeon]
MESSIWEDIKNDIPTFEKYLENSPDIQKIHYWNLPNHVVVDISNFKLRSPSLSVNKPTIKTIKKLVGKNSKIEKKIIKIVNSSMKRFDLNMNLPLKLNNRAYVSLYSLMISEGSHKNEFRLQVPEKELHQIFLSSLENLFPNNDFSKIYSINTDNGVLRSTASSIFRYIIPIPAVIPKFILKSKEFSRIYLRIAFEAEGSALTEGKIQISRSIGLPKELKIIGAPGDRIYMGKIKEKYPKIYLQILKHLPSTLLGEYLMLKNNFGIECRLTPESVRINKTIARRGRYSAKWKLIITSINKNKFAKEIGFLSKSKNNKLIIAATVPIRKPKFFALQKMVEMSKGNVFTRKEFIENMKNVYKHPKSFIKTYNDTGVIKRVGRGKYKIINSSPQERRH